MQTGSAVGKGDEHDGHSFGPANALLYVLLAPSAVDK